MGTEEIAAKKHREIEVFRGNLLRPLFTGTNLSIAEIRQLDADREDKHVNC